MPFTLYKHAMDIVQYNNINAYSVFLNNTITTNANIHDYSVFLNQNKNIITNANIYDYSVFLKKNK
jgi:L-rhamnose mutarotase